MSITDSNRNGSGGQAKSELTPIWEQFPHSLNILYTPGELLSGAEVQRVLSRVSECDSAAASLFTEKHIRRVGLNEWGLPRGATPLREIGSNNQYFEEKFSGKLGPKRRVSERERRAIFQKQLEKQPGAKSSKEADRLRARAVARFDTALQVQASETGRPVFLTEGQMKFRRALGSLAMPPLDRGTYLSVDGEFGGEHELIAYPGGLKVQITGGYGIEQVGGGLRGEVYGKSRQARRRQMAMMMQLRPVGELFFVTLTLSDALLANGGTPQDAAELLKSAADKLKKRVLRRWPSAWGMWGQEWQFRKSGDFEGQMMPHLHVIMGNIEPGLDLLVQDEKLTSDDYKKSSKALRLQKWFKENWADVCGLGDEKHLRRGADVRDLDSRKKIYVYVSKYTGKAQAQPYDAETGEVVHTGRMWGYWNRKAMPLHEGFRMPITDGELIHFKRLIKRWLKARGKSGENYASKLARQKLELGFVVFGFGLDALSGAGLQGGDDVQAVGRLWDILEQCAENHLSAVRRGQKSTEHRL